MADQVKVPPAVCPSCGVPLSDYPYAQIKPSKSARVVRKIALWLLPAMAILYLVQLVSSGFAFGVGTGAGYFALAWISGPSLLLYMVSRMLPRVRQVICLRCSWNADYPLPKAIGRVG